MVTMQTHKFVTLFVLLLFSLQFAIAQNKIITGTVTGNKDSSKILDV